MQLSVHHSFYEALRWLLAHPTAVWHGYDLVSAGMRPRNAFLLRQDAMRRQPAMEACTYNNIPRHGACACIVYISPLDTTLTRPT